MKRITLIVIGFAIFAMSCQTQESESATNFPSETPLQAGAEHNLYLQEILNYFGENPDITGQYLRFLGIAAVGLVINNLTIWLLHGRFRLNFYLAKLFAIGVVTFWNFFMNYFFTF